MLHNLSKYFPIRDNIFAVWDEKNPEENIVNKQYIFRIIKLGANKDTALGVAYVSEHSQFKDNECYTEIAKLDKGLSLKDFIPLYLDLGYEGTWFKRKISPDSKLEYLKVNRNGD